MERVEFRPGIDGVEGAAAGRFLDDVVKRIDEIDVVSVAAVHHVAAGASIQLVPASVSVQEIIAAAAGQLVRGRAADQGLGKLVALKNDSLPRRQSVSGDELH